VPRANAFAGALGAVATILVAGWLLTERDPPVFPALILALVGNLLVAVTYRRIGWSRSSTLALILCLLPWALRIGGEYVWPG
jgi:hypothetical protein